MTDLDESLDFVLMPYLASVLYNEAGNFIFLVGGRCTSSDERRACSRLKRASSSLRCRKQPSMFEMRTELDKGLAKRTFVAFIEAVESDCNVFSAGTVPDIDVVRETG